MKKVMFLYCIFVARFSYAQEEPKNNVLLVVGASCSGKSTLSQKLLESLGGKWKLVEFDVIEHDCKSKNLPSKEDDVIALLIKEVNKALLEGHNVVIDTNVYRESLKLVKARSVYSVLVHCPLSLLMERDKQRNLDRNRAPKRSYWAARYVEKTFNFFDNNFSSYDILIDSSTMAVEESCKKVLEKIS